MVVTLRWWLSACVCLACGRATLAATNYTVTDIGSLGGGGTYGFAINDAGHVTGYSDRPSGMGGTRAFLYDGAMHDLGSLGGRSTGTGINAAGQVVGFYESAPATNRAYRYDGTMHDLGTLGGTESFAFGINGPGHVVGRAQTAGNTTSHAFIYRDGQMFDLNSLIVGAPTVSLSEAEAINDAGQIVARGRYGTFGSERAFLLAPVFEPSSVVLAGLGLLGFMGHVAGALPGGRRGGSRAWRPGRFYAALRPTRQIV